MSGIFPLCSIKSLVEPPAAAAGAPVVASLAATVTTFLPGDTPETENLPFLIKPVLFAPPLTLSPKANTITPSSIGLPSYETVPVTVNFLTPLSPPQPLPTTTIKARAGQVARARAMRIFIITSQDLDEKSCHKPTGFKYFEPMKDCQGSRAENAENHWEKVDHKKPAFSRK